MMEETGIRIKGGQRKEGRGPGVGEKQGRLCKTAQEEKKRRDKGNKEKGAIKGRIEGIPTG